MSKIVLKKSSVESKVPLAADLDYGELALNYADGKLYFKNASNVIKSFTLDDSVVTLTGTQTLTNKTLTAPNLNGGAFSGTFSGALSLSDTTAASSTTTGALKVAGGVGVAGSIYADQIRLTNNGNGTNVYIGDDVVIGDINIANTLGVKGLQDATKGYIVFGNANSAAYIGRDGTNPITVTGQFAVNSGTVTGTDAIAFQISGYANKGGTGYHDFLSVTNSYASATNATKFFRLNSTGNLEIINSAYTTNIFTLTDAGVLIVPQISADGSTGTNGQVLTSTGTGLSWTNAGTGTVTSVSGTGTVSGLTLTGGVTTSGNLTLGGTLAVTPSNFASQTANTVLAAPNGAAGVPTFRALVAADIPTLNQNTTGSAGSVAWTGVTGKPTTLSGYAITDAYTKTEIDSFLQGLDPKQSVLVATTANITLSATQTIDGIGVVAGDRVLVKNQTTAAQNGIYIVAAGAWTRAPDMNVWTEVPGTYVFAEKGNTLADTGWVCTADAVGTLDTTAIPWIQFAGAGTYTGNAPITVSGTAISLASSGVTAGTYGSETAIPTITVDTYGRITSANTSGITIGTGTLGVSIGASGATNTTVTWGTSSGFNANSTTNSTYDLKVGPALTALAALMTTAGAGFIKRGATADTYTIDTNTYLTGTKVDSITATSPIVASAATGAVTLSHAASGVTAGTYNNVTVNATGHVTGGSNVSYLTSYTETDTLASVTARGATTSTATTFNGALTANSVFTTTGYAIATFDVNASSSVYWTVVQPDGTAIANGHVYKITMSTSGTGTDTGEVYLLSNPDSLGWQIKLVSSTGRNSNYPYVFLDTGVPKVKTDHTNAYTIRVIVERYNLGNTGSLTTALGLEAYFGVDQGVPKFRGTWNGTDYTVWHAGNLTNLNQLTNGPGYITAESDTLASVTARGATTTAVITHGGLAMSTGTNVDQVYSVTDTLTLTTSWQDTTVNAAELVSGSYMVQVYVSDYAVGGGHYQTYYTGMMSWFSGDTNEVSADEIVLHRAGHASNSGVLYLRVLRTSTADAADLKLQIAGNTTNTGTSTYTYKFRRLI